MLLTLDHSVLFCLLLSQHSFCNIYVILYFFILFFLSGLRTVIISCICTALTMLLSSGSVVEILKNLKNKNKFYFQYEIGLSIGLSQNSVVTGSGNTIISNLMGSCPDPDDYADYLSEHMQVLSKVRSQRILHSLRKRTFQNLSRNTLLLLCLLKLVN